MKLNAVTTPSLLALALAACAALALSATTAEPAHAQAPCGASRVAAPVLTGYGFTNSAFSTASWSEISPAQNQTIRYHVSYAYGGQTYSYYENGTSVEQTLFRSGDVVAVRVAAHQFNGTGHCTGKSPNSNVVTFRDLGPPANLIGLVRDSGISVTVSHVPSRHLGGNTVEYLVGCESTSDPGVYASASAATNRVSVPMHVFDRGDTVSCRATAIIAGNEKAGYTASGESRSISVKIPGPPSSMPGPRIALGGQLGDSDVRYIISRAAYEDENTAYVIENSLPGTADWGYWRIATPSERTGTLDTSFFEGARDPVQWRVKVVWFDYLASEWKESAPSPAFTLR